MIPHIKIDLSGSYRDLLAAMSVPIEINSRYWKLSVDVLKHKTFSFLSFSFIAKGKGDAPSPQNPICHVFQILCNVKKVSLNLFVLSPPPLFFFKYKIPDTHMA